MSNWLENLSPDVVATARRLPLSMVLLAGAAIVLILANNDILVLGSAREQSLTFGFLAGAAVALAGQLFRESRPQLRGLGIGLAYILPLLVVGAYIADAPRLVVSWPLLFAALLWCSVAGFTHRGRGAERTAQQAAFWWFNYQAVTTACVGIVGAGAVTLGLFAIERALDTLFTLDVYWLFNRWLLPAIWLFFAPAYWLATLPRFSDFRMEAVERPEMLARALGVFAQFVLAPLLFVYGAILLVYTAQIVITQHLPQGTIAWMVTGFVVTGALAWLAVYPPFLAGRLLVRVFQRSWFWLTLVPLGLLAVGVFVRITEYGFTAERIELIVGFAWAAGLAALFLVGRGDIRAIPALAAILIAFVTVGPWSLENAPLVDQSNRLSAALDRAGFTGPEVPVKWTTVDGDIVRGAARYLDANRGDDKLRDVLAAHGMTLPATEGNLDLLAVFSLLHLDEDPTQSTYEAVSRDAGKSIDLSATPILLADFDAWDSQDKDAAGLHFRIEGEALSVWRNGPDDKVSLPLHDWAASEKLANFQQPSLDFVFDGTKYRVLADYASIQMQPDHPELGRHFTYMRGWLFSAAKPMP